MKLPTSFTGTLLTLRDMKGFIHWPASQHTWSVPIQRDLVSKKTEVGVCPKLRN